MRLLVRVRAAVNATVLRRREFLESGCKDRVCFLVLATMSHHFVGIRADKITFEAMEMRGFILHRAYWMTETKQNEIRISVSEKNLDEEQDANRRYLNWPCRDSRYVRIRRWLGIAGSHLPSTCPISRDGQCAFFK